MKLNYSDLELLVKLSSKQQMIDLCEQAFIYRKRSPANLPESVVLCLSQSSSCSLSEARLCLSTLSHLLQTAVFHGSVDPQDIFSLFPNGFHKNLRDLLTKIIIDNMAKWKADAITNQVSLPKLLDFDWRVDVKTSSDSVARMFVPTCILNLEIQEQPDNTRQTAGIENVNVELSKETLDTMLDGLGKIRDQLASVANR